MPKLPQHISDKVDIEFVEFNGKIYSTKDKLKSFMATILQDERERNIEEIENMRDGDSCECDNCHRWRKFYRLQSNKRQ